MATTTTHVLKFGYLTAEGKSRSFNVKYADQNAATAKVQAVAAALVTNKEIFAEPPASVESAELITTTQTDVALS